MAIMTNSLGSLDSTIVHHAYSRARRPMPDAGIDVHEVRWEGAIKSEIDTPPVESQYICLHAKAVVLDRRDVFIGSFNFSPRSRDLNTEMGILVHSPELGARLADYMARCMAPENAWRLVRTEQGTLLWESSDGTLTSQPSQSFWQEFGNLLFSFLPVEEHL
jgi:putative cardiolipin synthase